MKKTLFYKKNNRLYLIKKLNKMKKKIFKNFEVPLQIFTLEYKMI